VLQEPGFARSARVVADDMAELPGVDDAVDALLEFAAR
jgi:hypothetical protein